MDGGMTAARSFIIKYKIPVLLCLALAAAGVVFRSHLAGLYFFLTDKEGIKEFISTRHTAAPLVFMGIQVLQVMFAPVPGEISGFVGGYIFGTTFGFIYSSIGLAMGSAINFWVGRILGKRFVRRVIPPAKLEKFDRFFSHQGLLVLLTLFVFPGFPKDYLCLFLGVTTLPFTVFILLAGFGRMPGTLMLSLQGEFLFAQNYAVFGAVMVIGLLIIGIAVRYRKTIYAWIGSNNKG